MAKKKIGQRLAGTGLSEGHRTSSEDSYKELFLAVRAELDDVRTKYAAVLAKLDADAGVSDTDYAASGALAASEFEA